MNNRNIFTQRVHTGLLGDAQIETGISENIDFLTSSVVLALVPDMSPTGRYPILRIEVRLVGTTICNLRRSWQFVMLDVKMFFSLHMTRKSFVIRTNGVSYK